MKCLISSDIKTSTISTQTGKTAKNTPLFVTYPREHFAIKHRIIFLPLKRLFSQILSLFWSYKLPLTFEMKIFGMEEACKKKP